ncbi:MAG TPA: sialate O-acetylesterase [Polyangiaceae bacterium]
MLHRSSLGAALGACVALALACSKNRTTSERATGAGGIGGTGTARAAPSSAGSTTGGGAWDWTSVIGTGQSLAVGQNGTPVKSRLQPYANLKLSTGTLPWPVDPNDASLTLVPLVEPVGRASTSYPSSWPTNIAGETPHAAMANQITALLQDAAGRNYVTIHGEFGENGQCMTYLKKGATVNGVNGRAYQATLIETRAIRRLALAAGKSFGVGAIIITHGECDAENANYESDLVQLWTDYNADLKAVTQQVRSIPLLVSQQNSVNDRAASTFAQWKVGVNHPDDITCVGPKYQYESGDAIHLVTDGYRRLGEKFGQVYFERVILGRPWQPLQPTGVTRDGRVITVSFHVPVPPLAWETTFQTPHAGSPAWRAGNGFEVRSGNSQVTIQSVAIAGDTVQITCATDLPAAGLTVGYATVAEPAAMTTPFPGTKRWGRLRDSDPFIGSSTQTRQQNFALAFELPVP